MEMIDFDLELAKKITSGEIKGEVLYCSETLTNPQDARIVCFDYKFSENETRGIVLSTSVRGLDSFDSFNLTSGSIVNIGGVAKLMLKVPVRYTLKRGDFISNRSSISILDSIRPDDLVFATVIYKPASHTVHTSDGYCLRDGKLCKKKKHFNPFQKVIVYADCWRGDFFSHTEGDNYITTSTRRVKEDKIKPYEGNEHLLGTK